MRFIDFSLDEVSDKRINETIKKLPDVNILLIDFGASRVKSSLFN